MSKPGPPILLVEDTEDDVFIMERALKATGVPNPLHVVTDGQNAIDYLAGTGSYSDRERFPLPLILFLDLKLPYVQGFEVLSWIRTQESLNGLAVVVLTSSDEERDHRRAEALGAKSYLVKPPKPNDLRSIFAALEKLTFGSSE